ncbi:signal peptidase I [Candidatus Falkowbacteria bacterium]|uniref:Signal peptidase I n=1 Tax=Candidatus Buchananbacteria bacterium CG10_big_fil_rev_8_21_14_0_10_33_19 TaxID=1974525 RepID=A0A2H0W2X6_9BACT|nr:signal peptidase I [Candidatus Falkowbacteria bacterium]PIS05696.1 MAG: signal peptidase I [Candidatus Buchananbacteria bacterium CG10_big_fil_rev_8_21_14_0_10_33_19]
MGQYSFGEPPKSRLKKTLEFVWEMTKITCISLVIILPIRYFLIQPFYVKGASMEPNFYDHEYLIIDEITYRFNEPKRGDIIVFKYPKDPRQFFIKRVIGLPGETVKIKDGLIFITSVDGQENVLSEDYLPSDIENVLPVSGYGEVVLNNDEYYLMGDNRDQSLDSRVFGPVKADYIIGRTWLRGWPFNRLTLFNTPEYGF